MSTQVQPEEAQAILDAVRAPGEAGPARAAVASRDFALPLRLSSPALDALRKKVVDALSPSEAAFSHALRGSHTLQLGELREVSAEGLFADLSGHFTLLRFEVDGQPGWLHWDNAGAVAAIEVILGATAPAAVERPLSSAERRIVGKLLGDLLERVAAGLDLQVLNARMVTKPEEVGSWTETGAQADRARLRVNLEFDGPGGPSSIDLYLPGIGCRRGADAAPPAALPTHLAPVTVEIAARLGACEVPLGELLRIEVGDVIPLDAPEDGSLNVLVEEVACARARWGTWRGQLAIQIMDVVPDDPAS